VHIAIRAAALDGWVWQPEFHNIQIRDIRAFDVIGCGSEQGGDAVCAEALGNLGVGRRWATENIYGQPERAGVFGPRFLDDLRDARHP
jgi:hypothetical protein